jgi:hypothetical protein
MADTRPANGRVAVPLALALVFGLPRPAKGENQFSYKYELYQESDDRISVQTQSASLSQDFGTDSTIALSGTMDAIVGATPTGIPAGFGLTSPPPPGTGQVDMLPKIHDHRKAWTADLIHQFSRVNVDAGFAYSREHDYTSYGWSLNTLTDFNQKNTTLIAGAAGTEDYVEVFFPIANPWLRKHSFSADLGVTQILGPNTSVTVNFTWSRFVGYLSDQYKEVGKLFQVFPGLFLPQVYFENRPNNRDKGTAYVELNQAVPGTGGAIDAAYRYYHDTYSTSANAFELAWVQHVGSRFLVQPDGRIYQQSAANFYYYRLDDTNIAPMRIPTGRGPFYSSDYRLSAFRSYTYGMKVTYKATDWLSVDVAFHKYDMEGTDGITPQNAYARAKITTFGGKITW